MNWMIMHINISTMKYQSITHLTKGQRNGTQDDSTLDQSLVEFIKCSPLIQRFAIHLLLLHRKGVTSFEDLRTIDGQLHDTFKDAARAMGLLENDAEHRRCLQEVAVMNMPSQMRQLFATLMVFQTPYDIRALFEDFKEAMCEDYIKHDQLHDPVITLQKRHIHLCLWDINTCLRVHGKCISDIQFSDLPQLPDNFIHPQNQNEDIDIVNER